MWIHLVIFASVGMLCLGIRLNKIHFLPFQDARNRKLFLMIVLLGNLMGAAYTWQKGSAQLLEKGSYLVKEESGAYEQVFQVDIQGEELAKIRVQVPAKEVEQAEETAPPLTYEESLKKQLMEEITRLNEEKQDPDKYYLPEMLGEKVIRWKRPGDTTGALLAALCLLGGIVLVLGKEKEKENESKRRMEQMFQDYPNLIMKLTLLVQAGMTVRMAFRKISMDYKGRKKQSGERYAYEEMLTACYEMERGISEAEAYERFGERCGQVKYKTLSTLLVQNLQKGSQRLLEMLEMESTEAFDDRKRKARVLGEAAATKLLIPMMLMLLIVLAIIMIPAVLSFYG